MKVIQIKTPSALLIKQQGSILIEILLGLFLGVFIAFSATTSFNIFQSYSRTSNSGNDAMIDGMNALYLIENDIRMAGFGMVINQQLACDTVTAVYTGGTSTSSTNVGAFSVSSPGGSTPDSIKVVYGTSALAAAPINIVSGSAGSVVVNYFPAADVSSGDYGLFADISTKNCVVAPLTSAVTSSGSTTINYDSGSTPVAINPPNSFFVFLKKLQWRTWQISNNTLMFSDASGTTSVVADNIVQLVVQYGITNGTTYAIDQWVYPSDASGLWITPDVAHQQMIRAVRVAIVSRSSQKEKPTGGSATCNTTNTAPVPWSGASAVNLTADTDWKCYRYRVYQTIIPLKNLIAGIQQ